MPRANWDVMQQYPILIPSPKLLQEFNTLVNLVTNQITIFKQVLILLKSMLNFAKPAIYCFLA